MSKSQPKQDKFGARRGGVKRIRNNNAAKEAENKIRNYKKYGGKDHD